MSDKQTKRRGLRRWLKSTSRRTFVLYPILIIIVEILIHKGDLVFIWWGIPLLPWGYLQYSLCGKYRTLHGGGGPGLDNPPNNIVERGIYAWTRNPMYLGHLIFMTGLAITFTSLPAVVLLLFHFYWFQGRVKGDEAHLTEVFGQEYLDYMGHVKRWIPGLF
ncbi:MAG: methyltransferase family protein [Gammaproteobacteria bacterium]|jgi:hypothetical protein